MDYFVRQNNGEYPKVSETELIAMAEAGLISEDTQVRKALMPTWTTAKEIPVLAEVFKRGSQGGNDGAVENPEKEVTSFENSFIPVHGSLLLRIQAWFLDVVLLLILFFILCGISTAILRVVGSHINEGALRIGGNYVNVTLRSDRTADRRGALVKERLRIRKLAEERYQEELTAVKAQLRKAKADRNAMLAKLRKEKATREEFDKVPELPKLKFPQPPPVQKKVPKFNASRTPTITDDAFEGCYAGTLWVDNTAKRTFVCISGEKNKAVWMTLPMVNSAAIITIVVYILLGLFLLVGSLMLRAQTIGMWYFGIFLSDAKDYRTEVLELRAFLYWLISVLTFYLNPLFLLIKKPTLAELITGTRVISTVSKKR